MCRKGKEALESELRAQKGGAKASQTDDVTKLKVGLFLVQIIAMQMNHDHVIHLCSEYFIFETLRSTVQTFQTLPRQ